MRFKSRKDNLFTIVITSILLLFAYILYVILSQVERGIDAYISVLIIIVVGVCIFWMFYYTHYEISKTHLKYQSGFIKGRIEINNIQKIIKNKTLWVGLKPATAQNGLIIKYNKYDEIYISPLTNDTFITEILKHNSKITISE